ncbi:hypothetical protein C8Q76DRAFT_417254 [Earliella scabrosa]|nr:hypothetical protein C8Q76DRAFT_417254 [Earliella scabrosa]
MRCDDVRTCCCDDTRTVSCLSCPGVMRSLVVHLLSRSVGICRWESSPADQGLKAKLQTHSILWCIYCSLVSDSRTIVMRTFAVRIGGCTVRMDDRPLPLPQTSHKPAICRGQKSQNCPGSPSTRGPAQDDEPCCTGAHQKGLFESYSPYKDRRSRDICATSITRRVLTPMVLGIRTMPCPCPDLSSPAHIVPQRLHLPLAVHLVVKYSTCLSERSCLGVSAQCPPRL